MKKRSVISLANEVVSIVQVCHFIGMDLPDDVYYSRSMKVHCPFGPIYHSDQGAETAFRVYVESNSAFCFACKSSYTPTWLAAQAWGLDSTTAATELLTRVGYKPLSLAEAWAEAARREIPLERAFLAEALKVYCARICPGWDNLQFDPAVAPYLTRCLALLDCVEDETQAQEWLTGCKSVMSNVLAIYLEQHGS